MIGKAEIQKFIQEVRTHLNNLENAIGEGVEAGGPVNPPNINPVTSSAGGTQAAAIEDIDPSALPKDDPAETVEGQHKDQTSKIPADFPDSSSSVTVNVPSSSTTGDS